MYNFLKHNGFTLVEVMVAGALMGGLALGAINFYHEQQKRLNYWEFQGKREYFRQAILGQFLNDERNCGCLFGPVGLPQSPTAIINAISLRIGSYNKDASNPELLNCAAPNPSIIDPGGADGVKLISVQIKRITPNGSAYIGDLEVRIESTKEVTGQKIKGMRFKVGIHKNTSNQMTGCSMRGDNSIANQLAQLFKRIIEISETSTASGQNLTLIAQCPVGTKLLSCGGGPGDQNETGEGYFLFSDYQNNKCTMKIWDSAGGNTERNKITNRAYCYPLD